MRSIIQQLIKGVKKLHEHNFVHTDIKPANVFLRVDKNKVIAVLGDIDLNEIKNHRDQEGKIVRGIRNPKSTERYTSYEFEQEKNKAECVIPE